VITTRPARSSLFPHDHELPTPQAILGIGLSTLRSWVQKKREPSGAARMLIAIALKHPDVLREAVV
jgi:hypothetical protein